MRPGNPLENQLLDIAFGAVFGGQYSTQFSSPLNAVCPQCGKTVKARGLQDHVKAVHEKQMVESGS